MDDQIKLKDALQLTVNEPTSKSIHVKVFEKHECKTYKDGKSVCEVIVGDETDCTRLLIYDQHNLQMFRKDGGVIISDFIVKTGYLVVTRMTAVFGAVAVQVPEEVVEKAQNLVGNELNVLEAAGSPKKTAVHSVEGIIVNASPTEIKRRRSNQEEVSLKRARLRDESGSIELCLWRDLANTNLQIGDHVRVLNFEVTDCLDGNNKNVPALCNKSTSSNIEFLAQTDKYAGLLNLQEDLMEDDGPDIPPVIIAGFGPINVYNCCPNKSCYKKKVTKDYKCLKCGVSYSEGTVEKAVNGTFKVAGKPVFHYFTQEAEQIKTDLQIDQDITSDSFITEIIKHLPISARIKSNENKITKIKIIK